MKVLVTGGAGFIGSHTLDALRSRGDETALLDDFNDFYDPAIKRGHAAATGARIFEADLRDRSAVRAALQDFRPEAIIHLAARAGVRPSIENPRLYIDVNLTGTLNLLDEAVAAGVNRIVFSSSSSVYGNNPKVPFAETDPLESIISPYAVTKPHPRATPRTRRHRAALFHRLRPAPASGSRDLEVRAPRCRRTRHRSLRGRQQQPRLHLCR
jgi:UDP-glucuronate 4-epimerase